MDFCSWSDVLDGGYNYKKSLRKTKSVPICCDDRCNGGQRIVGEIYRRVVETIDGWQCETCKCAVKWTLVKPDWSYKDGLIVERNRMVKPIRRQNDKRN